MKYIFPVFVLFVLDVSNCKSQDSCHSEENKRKIYLSLKEFILKNKVTKSLLNISPMITGLQYDDLTFTHQFIPNNNKEEALPHFNMETIEVSDSAIGYTLIYGDHYGSTKVFIEIKDYPEEKGKIIQQKAEQHFCEILSKLNFNIKLSSKEAIDIATKDAGGFLGTWIQTAFKNGNWHISSFSKSSYSPNYYIIDAQNGKILLKLENYNSTDHNQQKQIDEFLNKKSRNIKQENSSILSNQTFLTNYIFGKIATYIQKTGIVKHESIYVNNNI